MERKTVKFEVKAIDEEQGIIEGYGSTFDQEPDSYGDIVDAGAFSKTIQENADTIVSLFNHNHDQPIGLPELTQDKKGLFVKIKVVRGVQKAEETLLLAKAGVIKRMSIGYDTIKQEMKDGIRHLKEVRLYDVSPVVFAANTNAVITDVKADDGSYAKTLNAAHAALQALLARVEGKQEPELSTPDPETEPEAADVVLDGLKAELDGFDRADAEARIEAMLTKITGGINNG